jgi:DNA helicase-2/ATP-dependent DNA helicase PcrA
LLFVGITRAQQELQLSYARYRDYRGQQAPTVPSAFLLELPRGQMELFEPRIAPAYPAEWDMFDDTDGDKDSLHDNSLPTNDTSLPTNDTSLPANDTSLPANTEAERGRLRVASVTTAASLFGETPPPPLSGKVDPNAFQLGGRVEHPTYGLGKVVALSGSASQRTATINFATAGQKKFIIAKSPLRPLS